MFEIYGKCISLFGGGGVVFVTENILGYVIPSFCTNMYNYKHENVKLHNLNKHYIFMLNHIFIVEYSRARLKWITAGINGCNRMLSIEMLETLKHNIQQINL